MTNTILNETSTEIKMKPADHLFAIYQDSYGFRAILRWYGQNEAIDISDAEGQAIMAAVTLDDAVEDSEGYDDDPTAKIAWLNPNTYINLLADDTKEEVRLFQWKATPQGKPAARRNPITGHFLGGGRGES